jgi:L-threonate 2-dehydrogenase
VIGLGAMGAGVGRSLVRAGFTVYGCDVRSASVAAFAADGGTGAASPAELGRHCAIAIVLVVNAKQVDEVLFGHDGCVPAMQRGSLVIASSTIPPAFAEALGERLGEHGMLLLDAPLSGGVARAGDGTLTVMASGEPAAFAAAEPVLDAIAERVYRLGDQPGTGSKVKTINQLLAGVHIAAAAEAIALGIRAGVDPAVLYDVISASAGSSWMFQNRVPHILSGDYTPLSAVNIFVKDLGIVLDTAHALTFPLPVAAAAHQQFLAAAAAGHGAEDDAAVVKVYQALSGIDLPGDAAM